MENSNVRLLKGSETPDILNEEPEELEILEVSREEESHRTSTRRKNPESLLLCFTKKSSSEEELILPKNLFQEEEETEKKTSSSLPQKRKTQSEENLILLSSDVEEDTKTEDGLQALYNKKNHPNTSKKLKTIIHTTLLSIPGISLSLGNYILAKCVEALEKTDKIHSDSICYDPPLSHLTEFSKNNRWFITVCSIASVALLVGGVIMGTRHEFLTEKKRESPETSL